MSRKALGRGLKALIPQADETGGGVQDVDIDQIVPNPKQPRKDFVEDQLTELADSIREHGVLEPLIVRPSEGHFQLVAGERRWRAARIAGIKAVPALVRELSDREAMELALVENLQREDLNALEEAQAYQRLMTEFDLTQEQVAHRVGKQRSTVANRLRLLSLGEKIQRLLATGELAAGHAKALLSVDSETTREDMAQRIVDRGLSVRAVEKLVREYEPGTKTPKRTGRRTTRRSHRIDPALASIESRLREALGTKVMIKQGGRGGVIEIEWYSDEDIERIVEAISGF